MNSYAIKLLELEQEPGWPRVGSVITEPNLITQTLKEEIDSNLEEVFEIDDKVTKALILPRHYLNPELSAAYLAAHAASSNQSDVPLSMNEPINPLVVESSVAPAAPEPASLTPAQQRKAELEARRAAVKAEAKALVAKERALAKAARDLARAKAKTVIEAEKQELKDTTKMLLEITKMIKQKSAYGLTHLEISFSTYDDYFEVTDIGIAYREEQTMSKMETIERDFYRYCDVSAADRYLFIQRRITNFDRFLELLADHVGAYIPAGTKVTEGLIVIKPHEPIRDRVLVYLKEEKLKALYETEPEPQTETED
jgi:hypothetical protein